MSAAPTHSIRCLAPGCQRVAVHRGLCATHYRTACLRIQWGETTWQELEATGASMAARRTPWRDGRKWLRGGAG
jgi:hypothetical protein